MLDRESEIYNSGVLTKAAGCDHAAIVITRDGVEVSASAPGFSLRYSNTWRKITKSWDEIDRNTRERSRMLGRKLEIERAPNVMEN